MVDAIMRPPQALNNPNQATLGFVSKIKRQQLCPHPACSTQCRIITLNVQTWSCVNRSISNNGGSPKAPIAFMSSSKRNPQRSDPMVRISGRSLVDQLDRNFDDQMMRESTCCDRTHQDLLQTGRCIRSRWRCSQGCISDHRSTQERGMGYRSRNTCLTVFKPRRRLWLGDATGSSQQPSTTDVSIIQRSLRPMSCHCWAMVGCTHSCSSAKPRKPPLHSTNFATRRTSSLKLFTVCVLPRRWMRTTWIHSSERWNFSKGKYVITDIAFTRIYLSRPIPNGLNYLENVPSLSGPDLEWIVDGTGIISADADQLIRFGAGLSDSRSCGRLVDRAQIRWTTEPDLQSIRSGRRIVVFSPGSSRCEGWTRHAAGFESTESTIAGWGEKGAEALPLKPSLSVEIHTLERCCPRTTGQTSSWILSELWGTHHDNRTITGIRGCPLRRIQ